MAGFSCTVLQRWTVASVVCNLHLHLVHFLFHKFLPPKN